ncbi:MAG: endonuclease III [Thiotrichales bacterium]|jgi:endonuclease-3|nr:endonuclease III [Thiotrichales bacterium]MBT3613492.1 endonuclease III [Thiotrichales bacterium]MBT3753039.1 endonuclease III [Thiotrichales bacterium]MBT3837322.1 endonuclease III [Thiotrichales bacterium]MBT4151654.1 endonuclease III [Thiotrichales bacterium]
MNKQIREEIFTRLAEAIPEPTTELNYNSNFELLAAVLLSAQATDISVNKATTKLFPVANTPERIYALGESKLKQYIKTIGLFNSKAKHLIETSKILVEEYESVVPDNRTALESLPGVGRKTANVILNTAFGQPTIAVDTHIFRVSNRTRIARGKTVLEVERGLIKFVPKQFKLDAHHLLILHGRYTCIARTPKCDGCCIIDLCEYREKRL